MLCHSCSEILNAIQDLNTCSTFKTMFQPKSGQAFIKYKMLKIHNDYHSFLLSKDRVKDALAAGIIKTTPHA